MNLGWAHRWIKTFSESADKLESNGEALWRMGMAAH